MSPKEAKEIIETLANGINPDTHAVLSEQSVFNSPQVIRALFVAVKALDGMNKKTEKQKALPSNAGRPWSTEEDNELLKNFDEGTNVKDIAQLHGRTPGSIASRLVRLGKIQERTEVYTRHNRQIQ